MNSYIKTVLLFFKVCATICCGCNKIDLYQEEVNESWNHIKQEKKLNYHKNKLKNICSNILDNKNNKHYEIVFEYNKTKIDIQQIVKDIDNLNIKNIIQLEKDIIDYYKNNHSIYLFK
ncbi:MAG: hypothetical protein Q8807_01795 ['Waltheria sp.' little leaf phytoplasma]|nr:hypothetical protein ['Waltheria sp.' little leaf phytoplasma]